MKVLITGSTSGIGYDLGCELVRRGHTVYFTTKTIKEKEMLQKRLEEENIKALCFKMDITTEDIKLVDKIDIDCLVNHAGIGIGGSILYMESEYLRKNYEVNVFSSFRLLKRVYQNMEKKHIQGKIFVTSSLAGQIPLPFLGCYTSSKAAISMLVKTIHMELEYLKSNISISLIEPGAYHTGFNQVMIDNKKKYMEEDNKIYQNSDSINRLQRNLFALIEKQSTSGLVRKVAKEIENKQPKFHIKVPVLQGIIAKIILIFTS